MQDVYRNRHGGIWAILRFVAIFTALAVFAGLGLGQSAAAAPPVKRVLVMYSYSPEVPFYANFTSGFKKQLMEETSINVQFSYEYLDLLNYASSDNMSRAMRDTLRQKYEKARPDVIVIDALTGVDFVTDYCREVFGDTPVVFYFTRPTYIDASDQAPNYTFCFPTIDSAKNAELILSTLPTVQQLYVIIGESEEERKVREGLPRQLAALSGRVAITYLGGLKQPELLQRIRTIQGPAAILFVDFGRDSEGTIFVPARVLRQIREAAQVPVFGSYTTHIGDGGAVGGYALDMNALGREVGKKTAAILLGTAAPGKSEMLDISEYRFDWDELKRWGVASDRLPPGSVILNKPPSLWLLYKWQIAAAGSLVVALVCVLVVFIALQRQKWLSAERKVVLGAGLIDEQQEVIRERTSELHTRTDELHNSDERFRQIFENSPVMIAIVRMADNRFIEVNQRYLNVFGYAREEVIGRTPKDLNIFVGLTDEYLEAWQDQLRSKETLPPTEYILRTKAGSLITVLATFTLAQVGSELCRITTLQDITKEKQMETDLLRLDRLNIVGEMAASIGHEVRNPLTTVRGYLQMLQRKQDITVYHEQFKTMIEELDRANTIITDFLSLAKNKTMTMRPYNLNDVVSTLLPLLQAEALRTGHELAIDMGEVPDIDMDDKEIRQLLLNLARNAFEAMGPGGMLTIKTRAEKGRPVLALHNTGPEIPPEVLPKLGTPFFTTKETGTGLGLPVCYRIAERHGAKIEVKTSAKGTTFTILFKTSWLKGNFGTAWQNQQKEFDNIPAPIFFTTNCLMTPKASYADRVFTTDVVGFPEMKHISAVNGNKDFGPVIAKALELGGYKEDQKFTGINGGNQLTTGFARNTVMGVAGTVIDAVKAGAIKHFFLVGGCDGAKPGRNYYTEFVKQTPKDTIILTLACGKYRFNDLDIGNIGGIPRILDMGQCNDAYSAIQVAVALADAFNCSVNELPLTLVLSWYEQKAVCILLTLLALGIKDIYIGPSLPAFLSGNVLKILVEKFNLHPITTPAEDLKAILG